MVGTRLHKTAYIYRQSSIHSADHPFSKFLFARKELWTVWKHWGTSTPVSPHWNALHFCNIWSFASASKHCVFMTRLRTTPHHAWFVELFKSKSWQLITAWLLGESMSLDMPHYTSPINNRPLQWVRFSASILEYRNSTFNLREWTSNHMLFNS
jgi:hypothetical protein